MNMCLIINNEIHIIRETCIVMLSIVMHDFDENKHKKIDKKNFLKIKKKHEKIYIV